MRRRWLALLVTLFLVVGCSEDMALAQDFIKQWAFDHAPQIASNQLGIPSGDPYVDAAVEAGKPIADLLTADADMAQGRKNSDPVAMDAALKLRPHDWSYETSRANLALQLGDVSGYNSRFSGATEDSTGVVSNDAFFAQDYSELVNIHNRLTRGAGSISGYKSYTQCTTLYKRLQDEAGNNNPVGSGADWDEWKDRLADCEQIPH